MTYIIAEPCVDVKDGACVDVCPVDCIHGKDDADERLLYIEPDECIDCAACEPVCPVAAIFAEDQVPEKWKAWIPINYDWFKDKEATKVKVDQLRPRGTAPASTH